MPLNFSQGWLTYQGNKYCEIAILSTYKLDTNLDINKKRSQVLIKKELDKNSSLQDQISKPIASLLVDIYSELMLKSTNNSEILDLDRVKKVVFSKSHNQ